jgi:hypothetical protein
MSFLSALRSLLPIELNAAEIRRENCRKVNERAIAELLKAEREYWYAFSSKAVTQVDRDRAYDELERLRILERAS